MKTQDFEFPSRLLAFSLDPYVLETLANVPPGTVQRFAEFDREREHMERTTNDFSTAERETTRLRETDPSLQRYYTFSLHGWGPLKEETIQVIRRKGLNPRCDGTRSPTLIQQILRAQQIPDEELTRIHPVLPGLKLYWH